MQVGIHVKTLALEAGTVVDKEVPHEPGVEKVVQNDCRLESESKRRNVCTDANSGKGRLMPLSGG